MYAALRQCHKLAPVPLLHLYGTPRTWAVGSITHLHILTAVMSQALVSYVLPACSKVLPPYAFRACTGLDNPVCVPLHPLQGGKVSDVFIFGSHMDGWLANPRCLQSV